MATAMEETSAVDSSFKAALEVVRSHYRAHVEYAMAVGGAASEGTIGVHVDLPAAYPLPPLVRATGPAVRPMAAAVAQDEDPEVRAALQSDLQDAQNRLTAIQGQARAESEAAASQVQATKNTTDFRAAMDAMRGKTKENVDQIINRIYDAASRVGEAYPAAQPYVLATAQKVTDFIAVVITNIVNFVTGVINNIAAWVKDVVDKVRAFFGTAVDSVVHFFASL
ncbi:hypothetical protein [Kitasatospora purpeofusca]|uniref:hypothetical protein n=1 Tax=Kitasatospora purpeofusca TaxID=67352 RepID=UPI0038196722